MKFFILFSLLGTLAFSSTNSAEVSWETLKSLDMDPKTNKPIIPEALKKAISSEVTLKGFMMPLDYESKEISEFLFMPYIPSCMHVPPPPANQLVLVKMKKSAKIKPSFYPVELVGKLNIESSAELESSYKMDGTSIKELKSYTPPTPPPAVPASAHTGGTP